MVSTHPQHVEEPAMKFVLEVDLGAVRNSAYTAVGSWRIEAGQ
ncbi:hypothetical protein [Arthrobacter sp.]|nr:hypothetical protein [Arthrobacter sp.]